MSDESGIGKIDLDKVDWRGSREFFESLGEALDKLDDKDEAYDFTWVGKRKSIIEAGAPINKTFRPNVDASKNWDTTENLFIEGDNLDALKLLQESYLGKVKMIYIDPPYNTGKDFVYHDNFKANIEDYDEATEYKDETGNIQFKKNEKSNGRYHSDWLSMMYPRLKLARNLLTDDGVIFISIDDNEQANLKKLCDEVFGEDNFIANAVWNSSNQIMKQTRTIRKDHEYLMCYVKNPGIEFNKLENTMTFSNPDNDPRGPWFSSNAKAGGKYEFEIQLPGGNVAKAKWNFSKDDFVNGVVGVYLNGNNVPRRKVYESEYNKNTAVQSSIFTSDNGTTTTGINDTKNLFDGESYFDNPKPVKLIKKLLTITTKTNDVVVDFFCGSGTTAHAVTQLNAEDGGNRKWIMVQLPEETDKASEAYKAGYKTIPEIARERIRRAGDKIAKEHPDAKVDYGFRALTIADTNYKEVYKSASETTQQELLSTVDNVKEDRTEFDLLYGVLTATALELNRPLETRDIFSSDVFLYDYLGEASGLVACFADTISEEAIKAIAALKPLTAVFKDSTFPDSQAKVNLSEHFRIISPDTKVKVI